MSIHVPRLARHACVAGLLALLSACGGGGGGGGGSDTSISIGSTSLTFRQSQAVPATPQTVAVTFHGDGFIVGYPPGVPAAEWLFAEGGTTGPTSAEVTFRVGSTLPPGTYTTRVRFVTGHADGSALKYVDLPISYTVSDLSVSPSAATLVVVEGDHEQPLADQFFEITGSNLAWTAESSQPWLVLEQTAGTGHASVAYHLETADMAVGEYPVFVTVRDTDTGDAFVVPITLLVRSSILWVSPQQLVFELDAGSTAEALNATLTVADELEGADADHAVHWTLDAPDVPWLKVSATEGTTAPSASVQVSIDPDALAGLDNGEHTTTLNFHFSNTSYPDGGFPVPVALYLSMPRARAVMPRVAVAGTDVEFVLHGQGLNALQASDVVIGDAAPAAMTVTSDRTARIKLPAGLQPGTYDVGIGNALGVDLDRAQVVVVGAKQRPYAAIPVSGIPTRVVFDDRHETLWAADFAEDQLESYRYDGQQWVARSPIAMPHVRDIALDLDGDLLITTRSAVLTLDLDNDLAEPAQRAVLDGLYFNRAGLAGNGALLLSTESICCRGGQTEYYAYDVDTFSLGRITQYPNSDFLGEFSVSGDGTRLYLDGAYEAYWYDSGSGLLSQLDNNFDIRGGANRHGTRLANLGVIFDGTPDSLGGLTDDGGVFTAFGPLSQRAYGFRVWQANPNLGAEVIVSNLAGPVVGGLYPEISRISLADDPVVGKSWDQTWLYSTGGAPLAVSADERTLFIRGLDRLVIVPLPAP